MRLSTRAFAAGRWMVIASAASAQATTPDAGAPQQAPGIEIRFASSRPTPGFRPALRRDTTGTVYVAERALATDSDFVDVRPVRLGGSFMLDLILAPAARQRVVHATRGRVGSSVAVVVGAHVVAFAPIVDDTALGAEWIRVGVPLPDVETRALEATIAARWPVRQD